MPKIVPEILRDHILPFDWDVRKVWALEAEIRHIRPADFAYLLELPLWSSVPNQGLLFDISPIAVIRNPASSIYQTQRLHQVDIAYPIDILRFQGRPWVLDGVHRIAKHFILNTSSLPARFHDENIIPAISVG